MSTDFPTAPLTPGHKGAGGGAVEKSPSASHTKNLTLPANRLLQMMLLNRLYMFKTSEQDMQWLHEEMQLDLGMQHAITYRENRLRVSK